MNTAQTNCMSLNVWWKRKMSDKKPYGICVYEKRLTKPDESSVYAIVVLYEAAVSHIAPMYARINTYQEYWARLKGLLCTSI